MIILHLASLDNATYLLPERIPSDSEPVTVTEPLEDGMPSDYCLAPEPSELRKALKQFVPDLRWTKARTEILTLWMPSRAGIPCSSRNTSLSGESEPEANTPTAFMPYRVGLLKLSAKELDTLLDLASEGKSPARGVWWGEGFQWMLRLYDLALHLTRCESFLPSLVEAESERWEARWIPVPDELQTEAMRELASSMPGAMRCLTLHAKQAPSDSGLAVTQRILAQAVDRLIRDAFELEQPASARKTAFASLHDAWIAALRAREPVVRWTSGSDLQAFAEDLAHWQRPIDSISRSPFRFCLRLAEPNQGENDWLLEYLVQPKADPSLLVPMGEIWENASDACKVLRGYGSGLVEFLLSALSQAGSIVSEVAASLHNPQPEYGRMATARAHRFLSEETPILRSAGFVLMLPKWWSGARKQVALRAKTKNESDSASSGLMSLERLIQVDYEAAMGEVPISLQELETLAQSRMHLVKSRGEWMEVDPDQLTKVLRFLQKHPNGKIPASELLRIGLGGTGEAQGIPILGIAAEGWLQDLLDRLTGKAALEQLPQPAALQGTMRPYQLKGFSWLAFLSRWGLGACLADDMGLGKTLQCLAFLEYRRHAGEKRPVLLLSPTSVVNNWMKEASKFTPMLKTIVHHGTKRLRGSEVQAAAQECHLFVTSYGHLLRDHAVLSGIPWSGMVLDEAQTIKNPHSKLSKAVRGIEADFRVEMTGTPVENHVGELWSHLDFLNPGWLGNHEQFKRRFFVPIQKHRDAEALETLRKVTGPFILRRLKTDKSIISDLPEKIETREWCTLTREQAALYRSVVAETEERLETADGIERRGLVLALLSKLKQVCNHPAQFLGDHSATAERSGKLERTTEIIEELRQCDDRVLVFTQFREMGILLQQHLQEVLGESVYFLHGGTSKPERDRMIDHFQHDENAPGVFVLSLKAAGTGITLTRANHVIHFDRWWNPAVEDQATDRAFRIGQKRNVQVHKLIVMGTLEERIDTLIANKQALNTSLIGTGEDWLGTLSNEDLRAIVKLGKEAVDE